MPSNGTRSKTGCLPCRRRRHKCDEQKPICRGCRRARAQLECVWPFNDEPARFVVSGAPPDVFLLPAARTEDGDFITTSRDEFTRLTTESDMEERDREMLVDGSDGAWDASRALLPLLPISPQLWTFHRWRLTYLIQYCKFPPYKIDYMFKTNNWIDLEVRSNSRVYIPGDTNLFQSLVMLIVLSQAGGPLRSTLLSLSAAERTRESFGSMVLDYKHRALHDLQSHLEDASRAEENILACVLQSFLEKSSGSRPAWPRHLFEAPLLF